MKTWTGQQVGLSPGGGGGEIGYVKNVTFRNISLRNIRASSVSITQCITFSFEAGDNNSFQSEMEDFTVVNVTDTVNDEPTAIFRCSAAAQCENINLNAIDLNLASGTAASGWLYDVLRGNRGFNFSVAARGHTENGTC
ncbi:hypothetical protein BKA64DRAFT_203855 [Cadophora sp. MPI-SDFR-AT-0126]|nr:hypothetical protein BKA64DRAFT_203855 [Leotiomycetes sp. MPI-SDFR-AT-0126]